MAEATGTLEDGKEEHLPPPPPPTSAATHHSNNANGGTKGSEPAPIAKQTQNEPTDAVAMAVQPEEQEYDDFGLPVKKIVPPPAQVTSPLASNEEEAIVAASTHKPRAGTREESDSDEDFKDANSHPISETATPQNGAVKPTPAVPPETIAHPANPVLKPAASAKEQEQDSTTEPGVGVGKPSETTGKAGHTRGASTASAGEPPKQVSEFSHQLLSTEKKEDDDDDDGGWQTMPAFAPFDMYDDDNKLVAKEFNEEVDETQKVGYAGLGGAGKGYTRVVLDDDAESVNSMDENTHYLFKNAGGTTSMVEEDEEARDAMSQLQATKDLLTEGQRIAYVGLTRLELSGMTREFEDMERSRKTKKEIQMAAEMMKMWAQKMMIRLYAHMDISAAEQVMIEQLNEHGVVSADLTPVLMANARVKNPMAAENDSAELATVEEEEEEEDEQGKGQSGKGHGRSKSTSSASSSSSSDMSMTKATAQKTKSPKPDEEEVAAPPPPYEAHAVEDMPGVKTPTQLPTSDKIDIDIRWTVLCDLFLVLIADSIYDSRSRCLLERVGKSLEIEWLEICRFEKKITDALEMQQNSQKENWNEEDHMDTRRKMALRRRYVMMGLATVGGGLVIGLSAGLLAPVIGGGLAAGFTTIGIAGTNSFLGGAAASAIITSGAAASGGLIGGRAANRRTGSVRTFEYRPLHNNKRVNLIVTISGWMTGKVDDVRLPFSTIDSVMGDIYSVLWEPEMLRSMGDTINLLATEALTQGLQQVLGSTILIPLMAALQLPVILTKLAYLIDNPWSVSLDRATAAGLILADSLIDRNLGTRPVTLVGYSIGSRVIFSCLQELSRKGALGLVQNAFLFGCPVVFNKDEYMRARTVVAGRFVNGYSSSDWILGYLFRLTGGGIRKVAGLAPIQDIPGLENMDVTGIVQGHMDYRAKMPRLLRECGWLVESDEFTEIEDADPENHGARQRELISEIEEARKELEKESKAEKGGFFSFARKKKTKKQAWEIYEDSAKPASSGNTEDREGNNHGVLFDVDAIRAELAKDHKYQQEDPHDLMLQVKELESTLPPMKLDVGSAPATPTPPPAPAFKSPRDAANDYALTTVKSGRSSLLEPSSGLAEPATSPVSAKSPARSSYEYRLSGERTPTLPAQHGLSQHPHNRSMSYSASPHYSNYHHAHDGNDDIQMTFDTSFQDDSPPPPPPKSSTSPAAMTHESAHRPGVKTSQTAPTLSIPDPWADDDDDPDFGKEKEMTMTFA